MVEQFDRPGATPVDEHAAQFLADAFARDAAEFDGLSCDCAGGARLDLEVEAAKRTARGAGVAVLPWGASGSPTASHEVRRSSMPPPIVVDHAALDDQDLAWRRRAGGRNASAGERGASGSRKRALMVKLEARACGGTHRRSARRRASSVGVRTVGAESGDPTFTPPGIVLFVDRG